MTAMVLLTANTMYNPQHDLASTDGQLVDAALGMLDRIVDETNNDELRSFHKTCTDLHQHAQQKRHQIIMMEANDGDSQLNFVDPGWQYNDF